MSDQQIGLLQFDCTHCGVQRKARIADLGSEFTATRCPACLTEGQVQWNYSGRSAQDLGDPEMAKQRSQRENTKSIIVAVVLALFIRGLVIEAFKIPSPSMEPSLLVGDQLFVKKFHYGIRVPFTKNWAWWFDNVERGEVIVFLYPENESLNFIKRVIALPGDTVRIAGHDVFVNGKKLPRESIDAPADAGPESAHYQYYRERNGEHEYTVQYLRGEYDAVQEFTVGPDAFFAMGDNRHNSRDSRAWGPVPYANIRGRAGMIWLPRKCEQAYGYAAAKVECDGFRWERFGMTVH